MKIAVIVFPGSNCDHDAQYAFESVLNADVRMIWHKSTSLENADFVFIPGGFSYGDYLRSGAIARFSPIMKEVVNFANKGGPVMGVCNGFQILTESHLLPGALLRNQNLAFVCKYTTLQVEDSNCKFLDRSQIGNQLKIPIAHADGRYYADADTLKSLQDNQQIAYRYMNENPNGSIDDIAGICNSKGNVMGMMPHPERAVEAALGSDDGLKILSVIVEKGLDVLA